MKTIFFSAFSLGVGGIETALVNLVNYLTQKGYQITLGLEKKEGIFLEKLDKRIKIIEYRPSECKITIIRKLINLAKRLKFIVRYKQKFDMAISYATYSKASSFMARIASVHNILWVHNEYYTFYQKQEKPYRQFFESIHYESFEHIIFVSKESKEIFDLHFPLQEEKTMVCNNIINEKEILQKAQETIKDVKKEQAITTFLNVGRHQEAQKKLSRLIQASRILKEKEYPFRVLMVGEGPDNEQYRQQVRESGLEQEIIFLGAKKNPYPYFQLSDYIILTSEYEGYPVVFTEAQILGKPIITTEVSDAMEVLCPDYGLVTKKEVNSIFEAMEQVIKTPFYIRKTFDVKTYNEEIIQKLEKLF